MGGRSRGHGKITTSSIFQMVQKTQRENKRKRQLDAFIVHPFIERSKKYIFPAFNLSTEKFKVISLGNS
jgi:hypothetical protein